MTQSNKFRDQWRTLLKLKRVVIGNGGGWKSEKRNWVERLRIPAHLSRTRQHPAHLSRTGQHPAHRLLSSQTDVSNPRHGGPPTSPPPPSREPRPSPSPLRGCLVLFPGEPGSHQLARLPRVRLGACKGSMFGYLDVRSLDELRWCLFTCTSTRNKYKSAKINTKIINIL